MSGSSGRLVVTLWDALIPRKAFTPVIWNRLRVACFYTDTWEVCVSSKTGRSLTFVRYFWQTCFISFTGNADFPSVLFPVFFVLCCSYVHGWIAEVNRLHAQHDSPRGLWGHLAASQRNRTRRRCTELQASRSSFRPADRRGSPIQRISITRVTPR